MGAFFGARPKKRSLAALEAEEFGVALGDHHVDVGDFHLAVNVGLLGAIWIAGSQAAASAVVATAVAAASERQLNNLLAFGARCVFDELAFCHDVPRFDCDRRPRMSCRYRRPLPIIGFCAGRMHG